MDKKYIALIIVALVVIIGVGGYFTYQEHQSSNYNNYLKKSDGLWLDARSSFTQINMENESSKTNINYINDSINFTDQAINSTHEMMKIAPDNATKEFARIRIEQFQESKKIMGLYQQIIGKMQTGGVEEAIKTANSLETQLTTSTQKLDSLQNQLIELVNSNPSLKNRLITVLGEERVDEMIKKPENSGNG